MKILSRIVALITLSSFMMLAGIDTLHHHATLQEKAHCSTCKIIAQNSAPPNPTPTHQPESLVISAITTNGFQPYLHFVFPSQGRSPPAY